MLDYSDPLSALFAALADPNRRAIVEALSRGPAPVGRLAEGLPITQARQVTWRCSTSGFI